MSDIEAKSESIGGVDGAALIRQLAATLNHEINNPLFVVSATLEDLLAESKNPTERVRLEQALECVWRAARAVKSLQELRQVVTTEYVGGFPMIDLVESVKRPPVSPAPSETGVDTKIENSFIVRRRNRK